ncbi:maleylpyruvate isomerase N-terminal domain-containing protein [Aeromicrobium massiliense]|uniref:maleylpyruvate isomerase N-terminal domain-containing protein n=1 Tax=Aeromicrobium massiliense TaxID=1464554 RepID=UPI0006764544|nr:maleylpyruvate isomerase N-terminal domain-containing protein [Aeromicrobium massiliense]
MDRIDRIAFVAACRTAFDLASRPEVADAWTSESSCEGMTVGGLAQHLLAQPERVVQLLSAAPEGDPIPAIEHYRRAAWVQSDPEAEVNIEIRTSADDAATAGHDAVLAHAREVLDDLPDVLSAHRSPDVVRVPWQGWTLTSDDFLLTRSLELVVHSDDLASSVGLRTPPMPERVVGPVLALLTNLAVERHGQAALMRTLSRPQRAPRVVSAFHDGDA